MKLTHKLMLGFLSVVILFSICGYYVILRSKEALQKAYIESTTLLADEVLDKIDRYIYYRLEEFQAYSRDLDILEYVRESNKYFDSITDVQGYIGRRDKEWTSAPEGEIAPFMQRLINNRLSEELRDKIEFYEEHTGHKVFGEVFVTNRYGANVAQTGKTTDYRQDDETWWQRAKRDGLYVEDVGYDESADVLSINFGIRIDDKEKNFLGIMKVVLNIEEVYSIIDALKQNRAYRNIANFKLVTKEGKLIYSSKNLEPLKDVFHEIGSRFGSLGSSEHEEFIIGIGSGGREKLFVHAHSKGYKDYERLGWILIIELDTEEIFAPANRLKNQILIISLGFIALVALMGITVSASIAKPIKKLMEAANEVGKGNLDAHIDIGSKDEIGVLAKTFNEMAKNLKQSNEGLEITNRELQIEVSERREAEEKLPKPSTTATRRPRGIRSA